MSLGSPRIWFRAGPLSLGLEVLDSRAGVGASTAPGNLDSAPAHGCSKSQMNTGRPCLVTLCLDQPSPPRIRLSADIAPHGHFPSSEKGFWGSEDPGGGQDSTARDSLSPGTPHLLWNTPSP